MLADEGPGVQEVRYCLNTLRQQMAARYYFLKKGGSSETSGSEGDSSETSDNSEPRKRECEQKSSLQKAEAKVEEQDKTTEMQTHMDRLKRENAKLQEMLSEERKNLRESDMKYKFLEKQLESTQQKNRSLDDLVKCQHKKLRNMIEQVQNARTIIDKRTHQVNDLKEKVSFLEAENKELHDRLNHLDKPEQQTNNPDKGLFSPGKKTLPFMMARIKN